MIDVVNIGIVGCGWISENAYLPALSKNERVKIVSVYDIDYDKAKKLVKKIENAKAYKDYDLFLKSGITGVIICTPNVTHKELTVKALQKGKHVLCEKPVALNSIEMKEIEEVREQLGLLYVPGFVNRYREDINRLKNMLEEGIIGNVTRVEGYWIREKGVPRPGTWFTEKKLSGGGALIDLGSHIVDICLLLGNRAEVAKLMGNIDFNYDNDGTMEAEWFKQEVDNSLAITVESSAKAEFVLINGVEVLIELSWNKSRQKDYTQFIVYGTKGKIELNTLFGFSTQRRWEKPFMKVMILGKQEYTIEFNWSDLQPVAPFEKLCDYFVQSIINGRAEELCIEDGIRAVHTIDLIYQGEN
jgi:predicted dehydrogenase